MLTLTKMKTFDKQVSGSIKHSCSHCSMSQICLPLGVSKDDLKQLEILVKSNNTMSSGDFIYRQGDTFNNVYAIKSGTLKSTHIDANGNEQVLGFHLSGELIGLDGIYPNEYSSNTIALDTVAMCKMDYTKLTELCTEIPALQHQLLRLLSRDIFESQISKAKKSDQSATQKVATFINDLSSRYAFRGYSSTEFKLAMSRQDIANYLGLTPETVSRNLKQLKEEGILKIENRNIQICSDKLLKELVNCDGA